ncbi:MAG: 1,4-beta-xylanase [Bacillota bacterium]|nr:1,4-beta-xylanase [Bacillota bacterium]
MDFIKGFTFAPFAKQGSYLKKDIYKSLDTLKERVGVNFIIFVPTGLQDTPQSEEICYTSSLNISDEEFKDLITYSQKIGLRVALKPTVNCKNGTWRAHINFFDEDVPCEPKWSNWFKSYTDFQLHYAEIAEQTGCEMLIAGCEMVMSEHRENEWRKLISDIRNVYHGVVTYNTDKYQEHNVKWWDCVDVICSSGYYPIDDWENQLNRIEKVVQKFNKPFFFAEIGCKSTEGSSKIPNDWCHEGNIALNEQAEWYTAMFEACIKRKWISGFVIWDWAGNHYSLNKAESHKGFEVYGKPSEKVIKKYYTMVVNDQ